MEGFLGSLKTEHIHLVRFRTGAEARATMFEYLEIFDNRQRLHSDLGYRTPARGPAWKGEPDRQTNWKCSMRRRFIAAMLLLALSACGVIREPPGGDFKKVSSLVRFPDYYPGLGTLYVRPATLPQGPFYAYDRNGWLVSTIYMIPLWQFNAHEKMENLPASPWPVDHVNLYYTAGHPGVEEPHYHVILWHVSAERAASL